MNSLVPEGRNTRIIVLRVLLITAFAVLIVQLWQLQMIRGEYYQQAADVNRFRLERNPAPRGVIYDRRGHLLARNKPQITVSIIPAYLPEDPGDRRALLIELGDMLQIPMTSPDHSSLSKSRAQRTLAGDPDLERGILEILEEAAIAPYRPAALKTGVPRDVALILEEQHLDWPGVLVGVEPVREYLAGSASSHILGYVGPIPESLADEYEAMGYEPLRNTVGLSGVEYTFEQDLRGTDGQKLVEVDVAGREVQTVGEPKAVRPGSNLHLTLDLGLQEEVEEALRNQLRSVYSRQGVVVVLNPQTGEVLSLVSLPSYDNNDFTGGISRTTLKELQEDRDRPLVNHAVSGMFPPGSTFKILVAAGALEEKVITTKTRYFCGGIMWLPNRFYPEDPSLAQPFYCWIHHDYHGQHGSVGVISGLGQSCDIFFYQVGGGYPNRFEGLGEERIGYYAELFGMGAKTGIDLPGETPGLVPTVKWKRVNYGESWVTGDTYNMSIGQGFVLSTPLQLANATAAIANGGTLYRPQLVREITDGEGNLLRAFAPDVIREIPVSPETLDIVQQGMRSAVSGAGATAWALEVPAVDVAGKTGTAEYFIDRNKDGIPDRDREGNLPTHAWFTAYAPYKNPEIVVTVFVFGGGEGSATAVPIAGEILNYYFSQDRQMVSP